MVIFMKDEGTATISLKVLKISAISLNITNEIILVFTRKSNFLVIVYVLKKTECLRKVYFLVISC